MPWLNETEKALFFNFLEPNPPLNRHGNRLVHHVSFYSSEMKGMTTLLHALNIVYDGGIDLSERTHNRYINTLSNLDLLKKRNGIVGLTQSGLDLLNSGLSGVDADSFIFNDLMNKLISSSFVNSDSRSFFIDILREVQNFYNSIPDTRISSVLGNSNLLYFLQMIYSIGDEIKRFFRLDITKQQEAVELWESKARSLPSVEPTDFFEKTIYQYIKSTNSIQRDIRFRVEGVLKAYDDYISANPDNVPLFDSDNNIIFKEEVMPDGNSVDNSNYILDLTSTPIDEPYQLIVNGCPGSGKSKYLKDKSNPANNEVIRVTFHPEITYYDFVGSYKPSPIYESESQTFIDSSSQSIVQGKPYIDYTFVPGPFIEAYLKAKLNPEANVILIIEEINRAKSASVFGDIFQLLDRDDNGVSEYSIKPNTDLKNFLIKYLGEEKILLPKNLYIWATMNSADQGVMPLDAAFKRRWEFDYLGFRTPCAYTTQKIKYGNEEYEWENFRDVINKFLLSQNVHEDKLIGPYFLSEEELTKPKKVLNKLFLYLWEDVLRFNHRELMNFDSFYDLEQNWNDGQGSPLTITFEQ